MRCTIVGNDGVSILPQWHEPLYFDAGVEKHNLSGCCVNTYNALVLSSTTTRYSQNSQLSMHSSTATY